MFDLLKVPSLVQLDNFLVNVAQITTAVFRKYFLQKTVVLELELAQVLKHRQTLHSQGVPIASLAFYSMTVLNFVRTLNAGYFSGIFRG